MSDRTVVREDPLYPLTDGERFLIHRRRLRESHAVYCERLGVKSRTYHKIENDEKSVAFPPSIEFDSLTDAEKCTLHRRRLGLTTTQAGERFGHSRWYIHRAENLGINADTLLGMWMNVTADA